MGNSSGAASGTNFSCHYCFELAVERMTENKEVAGTYMLLHPNLSTNPVISLFFSMFLTILASFFLWGFFYIGMENAGYSYFKWKKIFSVMMFLFCGISTTTLICQWAMASHSVPIGDGFVAAVIVLVALYNLVLNEWASDRFLLDRFNQCNNAQQQMPPLQQLPPQQQQQQQQPQQQPQQQQQPQMLEQLKQVQGQLDEQLHVANELLTQQKEQLEVVQGLEEQFRDWEDKLRLQRWKLDNQQATLRTLGQQQSVDRLVLDHLEMLREQWHMVGTQSASLNRLHQQLKDQYTQLLNQWAQLWNERKQLKDLRAQLRDQGM